MNQRRHLFLVMVYAQAETSNKIMFSIIVAVLFGIRIYSYSVHCLQKWKYRTYFWYTCIYHQIIIPGNVSNIYIYWFSQSARFASSTFITKGASRG